MAWRDFIPFFAEHPDPASVAVVPAEVGPVTMFRRDDHLVLYRTAAEQHQAALLVLELPRAAAFHIEPDEDCPEHLVPYGAHRIPSVVLGADRWRMVFDGGAQVLRGLNRMEIGEIAEWVQATVADGFVVGAGIEMHEAPAGPRIGWQRAAWCWHGFSPRRRRVLVAGGVAAVTAMVLLAIGNATPPEGIRGGRLVMSETDRPPLVLQLDNGRQTPRGADGIAGTATLPPPAAAGDLTHFGLGR